MTELFYIDRLKVREIDAGHGSIQYAELFSAGCAKAELGIVYRAGPLIYCERRLDLMAKQLVTLSSDLTVITAEINSYKRIAGDAIFEIGRRLKHVKETKLAEGHGGWTAWCESDIQMPVRHANKFIQVVSELGEEWSTSTTSAFEALYQIATLPPEERERDHTLKSGETKSPAEMTVRELREVKAALKSAEDTLKTESSARKSAEERLAVITDENVVLRDTVESLASSPPPLPRIEVQTEYIADPTLSDRLKRYEAKYGDIDGVVAERIQRREGCGLYTVGSRGFVTNQREHKGIGCGKKTVSLASANNGEKRPLSSGQLYF